MSRLVDEWIERKNELEGVRDIGLRNLHEVLDWFQNEQAEGILAREAAFPFLVEIDAAYKKKLDARIREIHSAIAAELKELAEGP